MRPKIITNIIPQPPGKRRFIDMSDKTIGRLKVIAHAGGGKWFCECKCGNVIITRGSHLRSGNTVSCGCFHTENTKAINSKHGESRGENITSEYTAYCMARDRCNNPRHKYFKHYGGRGIKFLFDAYKEFLDEVGRKPTKKHSLDRIDNSKNYEPGNLRWSTYTQQGRNKRNNRLITIDGITKCQSEWSEVYNIPTTNIDKRRRNGWCDKCSVTLANGCRCPHKIKSYLL